MNSNYGWCCSRRKATDECVAASVFGIVTLRGIPRFLPLLSGGDLCPMKSVVWGGFILLGLPNILGFTIVVGLTSLLLRLKPRADGQVVLRFVDVMGGFATLFVGLLIERLFSSRPTGWLP